VSGSGEHQIDDSERNGYSHFKELLGKDDYEAKSISLLQKAEIPAELHRCRRRRPDGRLPATAG